MTPDHGGDDVAARVVVMGVSGSGKSTIGARLADELAAPFVDADDLHPESNVRKMRDGIPLTDEDRWPWLEAVGGALEASPRIAVACSALRRVYRDRLRAHAPDTVFVHLEVSAAETVDRMRAREGHFMPPALLDSQMRTLEPLEVDEVGVTIPAGKSIDEVVATAVGFLRR